MPSFYWIRLTLYTFISCDRTTLKPLEANDSIEFIRYSKTLRGQKPKRKRGKKKKRWTQKREFNHTVFGKLMETFTIIYGSCMNGHFSTSGLLQNYRKVKNIWGLLNQHLQKVGGILKKWEGFPAECLSGLIKIYILTWNFSEVGAR